MAAYSASLQFISTLFMFGLTMTANHQSISSLCPSWFPSYPHLKGRALWSLPSVQNANNKRVSDRISRSRWGHVSITTTIADSGCSHPTRLLTVISRDGPIMNRSSTRGTPQWSLVGPDVPVALLFLSAMPLEQFKGTDTLGLALRQQWRHRAASPNWSLQFFSSHSRLHNQVLVQLTALLL